MTFYDLLSINGLIINDSILVFGILLKINTWNEFMS